MSQAIKENGHVFVLGTDLGLRALARVYVCRTCGIVRNREGDNKQCRGAVKIGLRAGAQS